MIKKREQRSIAWQLYGVACDWSKPPYYHFVAGFNAAWEKRARTVRAKAPHNKLQDAIAKFTFTIERRAKTWVLQEKGGGCRPATMHEVVMWKFLQRVVSVDR